VETVVAQRHELEAPLDRPGDLDTFISDEMVQEATL
jgi:hypothetical protein